MTAPRWGHALRLAAVLLVLGAAGFPIYWMLVTSLTPSAELFAVPPRVLPTWSELGVYAGAFRTIPVAAWLTNSALIAAGTTVLSIALAVFPAYALSRFRFRGKAWWGWACSRRRCCPRRCWWSPSTPSSGSSRC